MSIEWRPMKAKKTQDAIKGETKMMWVDYTIKPGDVFIVNEGGWLIKSDELSAMIIKHEAKKKELA